VASVLVHSQLHLVFWKQGYLVFGCKFSDRAVTVVMVWLGLVSRWRVSFWFVGAVLAGWDARLAFGLLGLWFWWFSGWLWLWLDCCLWGRIGASEIWV
jgi:hypothetical protein